MTDEGKVIDLESSPLSLEEALDYIAVVENGYSKTERAEIRDTTPQVVSQNVSQARDVLED